MTVLIWFTDCTMKQRGKHVLWQEPADFIRYDWPRKGTNWLAYLLVKTDAGIELLTLYAAPGRFDFYTIEKGPFDVFTVKLWAIVKPPFNPERHLTFGARFATL